MPGLLLVEQRAARAGARRTAGTSRRCPPRRTRRRGPSPLARLHDVDDSVVDADRAPTRPPVGRRSPPAAAVVRQPRVTDCALLRRQRAAVFLELADALDHHQSGAAVNADLLQQPLTICGAIGSETSASSSTVGRRRSRSRRRTRPSPEPFGQHDRDRESPPFRTSASAAARSSGARCRRRPSSVADAQRRPPLQRRDELRLNADPSSSTTATRIRARRRVPLVAEDRREDREEHDRQQERQRLRDAVALEVQPADAQQRQRHRSPSSRSSRPVRWMKTSLQRRAA